MKRSIDIILVLILVTAVSTKSFAQLIQKDVLEIGEQLTVHSSVLSEDRILNVYLPSGYSQDSSKSYPVIYLLDGSMHEDFLHIAGIVQFESYSWINNVPESIVVGISNIDRKRDFTFPTNIEKDKLDFPTTGESAKFIQFIKDELQPLIRRIYHTNDTSTIIGQSLGGLLATEILFTQPSMFSHYLIVSPSLWWDKQSLFNRYDQIPGNVHVHIAVGNEGKVMVSDAKRLRSVLIKSDAEITFQYYKNNNHADILHEAAFDGLKKLFSQSKND